MLKGLQGVDVFLKYLAKYPFKFFTEWGPTVYFLASCAWLSIVWMAWLAVLGYTAIGVWRVLGWLWARVPRCQIVVATAAAASPVENEPSPPRTNGQGPGDMEMEQIYAPIEDRRARVESGTSTYPGSRKNQQKLQQVQLSIRTCLFRP